MPYSPILATLGYVLSPDHQRVLLIRRDSRPDDAHFGKFNGLGGKLEPDESIVAGMRREIREEAGIDCPQLLLRGTISWPGFGKNGEDWFGFLFLIEQWTGIPLERNAEGTLVWVEIDQLHTLPMWPGDRHFLPLLFSATPGQFHGVMPYSQGNPVSWHHDWLS